MSEFLHSTERDGWIAPLQPDGLSVPNRLEMHARSPGIVIEAALRERIAELEHAAEIRDRIVATVSHEMRTPLAAIGGYVELLRMGTRGPLNDRQLLDLQRIHRAYDHLLHVVDDLLTYHKLIAGQVIFEISEVSVDDLLVSVADLIVPQATERKITVEIERASRSVVVRADQERVRQILVNLLGNAIKFTAAGGLVRLRTVVAAGAAVVEVEDTGSGIPPDALEMIFRPFTQLRPAAAVGGAGLGLAISRDMARGMGGELSVTSTVGEGSCFALTLPLSPLANRHSH